MAELEKDFMTACLRQRGGLEDQTKVRAGEVDTVTWEALIGR